MTSEQNTPGKADPPPIWEPGADAKAGSNLRRFMALAAKRTETEFSDYAALYWWSIQKPEAFWPLVWEFGQIRADRTWDRVIEDGGAMPGARWFPGSRLNFAENLLRFEDEHPALIFRCENGERAQLSYRELGEKTAAVAAWLSTVGIGPGDPVVALMPNRPETVIAMLAVASLGAVWASASPDFGADGVLERFGQIAPRVLFTVDGYYYGGKQIDIRDKVSEVSKGLPSLEQIAVVPWLSPEPRIEVFRPLSLFPELVESHAGTTLQFRQLPFDHPLYILFSSGTTGKPKCIIHGAGGTLIQHLKELMLHTDLKRKDRFFYFTTCGWMMWNWLVSGLAVGATLILFDGSPFHPTPDILWDIAQQERISVFGTSAKYIAAVEKAGLTPERSHRLPDLRAILSTGSPLAPELFDYVYKGIKSDLMLASISGGTDIVSCFALGNPLLPVYRGELQCRGLGLAVTVFDEHGKPVEGERGELVCTQPFPCMPVGFWNDPDDSRYRSAYFERFPGVWTHGDFAELTPRGGLIIHGRSDAVLNPGGVRIGTAEIYRVVEGLPEVVESIAVGQQWRDDQRILLFLVLREELRLDDELVKRVREVIRSQLSPRHVPAKIFQVAEIPRTRSGKIVEIAVRDTVAGREVENREALANPGALDEIAGLPGLRDC